MVKRKNERKRGRPESLWRRNKRTCEYCGKKLKRHEITADHVIPLSRNGYDKLTNIVPACRPCNNEKGNMTADEYRAWKATQAT